MRPYLSHAPVRRMTLHREYFLVKEIVRRAYTNAEEDLAARFIRACGIVILSRNDRRYGAEIDILGRGAASAEYWIFEIKKKSAAAYPALSVRQFSRLRRAAKAMQSGADEFLQIRLALIVADGVDESVALTLDPSLSLVDHAIF